VWRTGPSIASVPTRRSCSGSDHRSLTGAGLSLIEYRQRFVDAQVHPSAVVSFYSLVAERSVKGPRVLVDGIDGDESGGSVFTSDSGSKHSVGRRAHVL